MDIKKRFGQKVKELRNKKGLSQESLALQAGIDRTYMPGIESGARNISIVVAEKIAKALDVPLYELFR